MSRENSGGVLMRGFGRRFVFSGLRAWLGRTIELPRLLRGVRAPRGAACLDIACGLGWASAGMLRRDPSARVVALDYDEEILPRTREYLRSRAPGAVASVCRADAKNLPFRDASFDLVFCLYGLHHVRGYMTGLREIARVLKSEGTFALIDPIRKRGAPPDGHHGTEVLTSEELKRMLGESGFAFAPPRVSMASAKVLARKAVSAGGAC